MRLDSVTRESVLAALDEHGRELRRLGVRRLGLFGSTARGQAGSESDLDFVVDLDRRTFDAYMDVKLFLEDLFGRRVDLVLTDSIKPRLRDRILGEAVYASGLSGLS